MSLASFPGLPRLQFLIACSMQKWSHMVFWLRFYILQAIKTGAGEGLGTSLHVSPVKARLKL